MPTIQMIILCLNFPLHLFLKTTCFVIMIMIMIIIFKIIMIIIMIVMIILIIIIYDNNNNNIWLKKYIKYDKVPNSLIILLLACLSTSDSQFSISLND